jgi:hypothetical protein
VIRAEACAFLRNKALGGRGGDALNQFSGLVGGGGDGYGGAIYNTEGGMVFATNCQFALNAAVGGDPGRAPVAPYSGQGGFGAGGALYTQGGLVHISESFLSNNSAASGQSVRYGGLGKVLASGGAIHNAGGNVTLLRVEASDNSVVADLLSDTQGGAIAQGGGLLSLTECYFHANRAQGGSGTSSAGGFPGGAGMGGSLAIQFGSAQANRCMIASNAAVGGGSFSSAGAGSGFGGGVFNAGALTVENTTIVANRALAGDKPDLRLSGSAYGGGIYNAGGIPLLSHVTAALNDVGTTLRGEFIAGGQGGGLFSANGFVTLRNTILAYSSSGSNCFGMTFVDDGNNISSDASCNLTASGSQSNTDPLLGPLADNGGPTATMALLPGSPAIDTAAVAFCPAIDQRGRMRPYGAGCDIGAFEAAPSTAPGRTNALTIERWGPERFRVVFAGQAGDTWRVLQSTDLPGHWMPYSTNTVAASGFFDFVITNTPLSPFRFFQTERP